MKYEIRFFPDRFKTTEKVLIFSMFVIPFLKGLFFKEVFFPIFSFPILLFILLVIKSKVFMYDKKILTLFTLQFIIAFLSVFSGINKEEAIYALFLVLMPVFTYFLFVNVKVESEEKADFSAVIHITLRIVFASGTVISIINFLVEFMFNNTDKLMRFVWVIPYANTLAVYLFASSIAGLFILGKGKLGLKRRVLIETAICINITALVFTYSRTMWVLGVIFYASFLTAQKSRRVRVDSAVILLLSAFNVILYSFLKWKMFLLIFALCASIAFLYEKTSSKTDLRIEAFIKTLKQQKKVLFIFIPVIITVILTLTAIIKSTEIYERVLTISTGAQELQERFAYYKDAVSIIKDFPVLGVGPGGWTSIQYKYQTAVYFSKYVHSSIFQTALDYGLTGLSVFLLQVMVFIVYSLGSFKSTNGRKYRAEIICLIIINSAILAHSILDLDFEFPFISVLFWINIAFLSVLSGNSIVKTALNKAVKSILVFASIMLILAAIPLYVSNAYYLKGMKSFNSERYADSARFFEKAAVFNPFSSGSYFMKGYALGEIYKTDSDEKILEESVNCIDIAQKYDKYNPGYSERKARIFDIAQDFGKSVREYGTLIALQPLIIENYEAYSTALLQKAEMSFKSGMVKEAGSDFNKIKDMGNELKKAREKLSPAAYKLKHKPVLTISPKLAYNMSAACYYLSEFGKARQYLKIASEDESYIPLTIELKNRFEKQN